MQIDLSIIESFGDGWRACITSLSIISYRERCSSLCIQQWKSQSVVISQLNACGARRKPSLAVWKA